jgi:hypothetical protein
MGNGDRVSTMSAEATVWRAAPADIAGPISIQARDVSWRVDESAVDPFIPEVPLPRRRADGDNAERFAIWPQKALRGSRIGPNRDGRPW